MIISTENEWRINYESPYWSDYVVSDKASGYKVFYDYGNGSIKSRTVGRWNIHDRDYEDDSGMSEEDLEESQKLLFDFLGVSE